MAGLKKVFVNAVETIFGIMSEAVKNGNYTVITDNGFDDVTEVSNSVRVIVDTFTQDDVKFTSFYDLIQSTDLKGLIPVEDLSVPMSTSNVIDIEGKRYSIVAVDKDPFNVLFTLLLRAV